ncbi:uncharacterized protein TNCV_1675901 [Trichonephila clavipes]|nr:uncharacterized protein TNCV_1675901 [Trichonephila clavipes]
MLKKVIENWTSRLDYIRASRGSPMPEIIFKIAVHKSIGVRGGGDLFWAALCKASQTCSIMLMSEDLGGQRECLNSYECFWSHSVAMRDMWGVSHCPKKIPEVSAQRHEWVQGPWTHEIDSIAVHVHQLESIGNETRQTRQHVSSHQQSNAGVDGPRRGIRLYVVQSTRVHKDAFGSESPYR